MLKYKYRPILRRLQDLISKDYSHSNLSELFISNGLNVSANALSNRFLNDGYLKECEVEIINQKYNINLFKDEINSDCVNIPIRGEVEASMGYGVTIYNENRTGTYSISQQLANDLGIDEDNSEIIFGRGNSMEPTIFGGDALLIDKTKKDINDGRIYCIRYEGQLLTKRLQKLSRTKIKIISDNKDYDAIIIDFEKEIDIDFEIIGEVRWAGRVLI